MKVLRSQFDALLVDLDGTVYRGAVPVEGAVEALRGSSERTMYVTNNAGRTPREVAAHLGELGLSASDGDVVTSAHVAAKLLRDQIPSGSSVLIVGTEALSEEVRLCGFEPVRSAAARPAAVVQGHSVDTNWAILAEASLAIRGGALWVACNVDPTLATERGILPGNGSIVAAVRTATGQEPQVAGKPGSALMYEAKARADSQCPLVIGDRLDTDIAGGYAADFATLLVMTGVSRPMEVLRAPAEHRPDYLGADLGVLDLPAARSAIGPVEGWTVTVEGHELVVSCTSAEAASCDGLRAACSAAWTTPEFTRIRGADARSGAVLDGWGLDSV